MTQPIIFDTDPGIDDAMALAFAHLSPDLELVGVTTTFGNGTIEQTTANAVLLQQRFGLDCGVYKGAGTPVAIAPEEPPTFVHGHDALGDTGMEIPPAPALPDAVGFIVDTVRSRPGEISIVAVGRMTNLARALEVAPDIADKVKSVVIMGGVLGHTGIVGNVTPVAEANIYGDPHAADQVMCAPWPLVMVGLDVTMRTIMTDQLIKQMSQHSELGAFLGQVCAYYQNFYRTVLNREGIPVHDSLAVAYLLAPDLFETKTGGLRVVTEGLAVGQTMMASRDYPSIDWHRVPPKDACIGVKDQHVLDLYMETMLR